MNTSIQQEIRQMLEAITINTALPRYIQDLDILLEDTLYFDICQRIFPELRMKIIKIGENQFLTPPQKMQQLINLLSKQLSIDLSCIKGQGILQGYLGQIHHFLGILWKFSQYEISKSSEEIKVKTEGGSHEDNNVEQEYPRSARDRKNHHYNYEKENESKSDDDQKQFEENKPQNIGGILNQNIDMRKKRDQEEQRKNVYQGVLSTIWNEKNRMNKASIRNNRKKKHEDLKQAKNKYKSYLGNYAKQTKAKKKRQSLKKEKRPNSAAHFQLPPEDFTKIDNFFQSFTYKFRDQKQNFLRKMKKIIREQEMDRMCYVNRIEREKNKEIESLTKKEMDKLNNEHKIKSDLLKQKLNSDKECIDLMKKQYEKYLRSQKKELKESKKKELDNIKDYIDQENRKVLMEFEDGGRIQQIILDMYKRY